MFYLSLAEECENRCADREPRSMHRLVHLPGGITPLIGMMRSAAPADLSLPVLAVCPPAEDGLLLKMILFFWFCLSRKVISMLMKSAGACSKAWWLAVPAGLLRLAWK